MMNNQFWLSTLVLSLCLALTGCNSDQAADQTIDGQTAENTPVTEAVAPVNNQQDVLGQVTAISDQEVTLALASQPNPDKIHVRPADDGTAKAAPPEPPTGGVEPDKQPQADDPKLELDFELTGESKTVTIPADLSVRQGSSTGDYTLIKAGSILRLGYTGTGDEQSLQTVTIME